MKHCGLQRLFGTADSNLVDNVAPREDSRKFCPEDCSIASNHFYSIVVVLVTIYCSPAV